MIDRSDKAAKIPSPYWAYTITAISVIFSLVVFIVLLFITSQAQVNRAKQIANNALVYRSELLDSQVSHQAELLKNYGIIVSNLIKANPDSYLQLIDSINSEQNAETDIGFIFDDDTERNQYGSETLKQLRDKHNNFQSTSETSLVFDPIQLEDKNWYIYLQTPLNTDVVSGVVDSFVDVTSIFKPIQLADNQSAIQINLSDGNGQVLVGNPYANDTEPILMRVSILGRTWLMSASPQDSWKGISTTFTNAVSFSILIILILYNLIFFLILRRQQNLVFGIQKSTQEIIHEAEDKFLIQAKLQKSDLILSKATSYAHIGIWEYDLDTRKTYWSDELFHILGQQPRIFPTGANYLIHLLSEEEYDHYHTQAQKVIRTKKPADLELTIHQPGGEDLELWMTIHPQLDEQGVVTGLWGLAQDITVIKSAEQELLVLNGALQMVLTCNHEITRATDELELIRVICKTITDIGGYPLGWIGEAINDELKTVTILAKSGVIEDYTDTVKLRWDDSKLGTGPTGRSIKLGKPVISQDLAHDSTIYWKERIIKENLNSVISIPFDLGDERRATISIYSERINAFDAKEKAILVQLAQDLEHGIRAVRAKKDFQNALEELKISQEKFAKIFEISPSGIALATLDTGVFVEVNEGFCLITGFTREEVMGKSARGINLWVNEEDRIRFDFEMNHSGEITGYEMPFRRKDGGIGRSILHARTLILDQKEMILTIITDVTEKFSLEESQNAANERYRLITENMSEVIWLISNDLQISYVSDPVRKMLGYEPADLLGKPWESIIAADSYQSLSDFLDTLNGSQKRDTTPFLVNFVAADQTCRSAEISVSKLSQTSIQESSWLCVARDITDRIAIEEALHESEMRWQYALEGSGEGVWDWNLVDNGVFYSPKIYSMLGYPETEHWTSVDEWSCRVHPDDLQPTWDHIHSYLSGKSPLYVAEFRMLCADGSYKWLADRGKIIAWDDHGTPTRMVGVHSDISETKRMVEGIQQSESQFRLLAERSSDVISRISRLGTVLYISPSCEQVLGYTEQELKTISLVELVHPEDRALLKFVVEHLQEYQEIQPLQFRLRRKDGEYIWVESTAKMVHNELTGEFEEVQLTTRDITIRVKAETALRESEEKLRALITQSVDGIVLISEEGIIIEWSRGQERLTGLSPEQAIGQPLWKVQFDLLPQEEKTEERRKWIEQRGEAFLNEAAIHQTRASSSEWKIQRKDGSSLFIQSTVFPIHTAHGYMGGAISRDITAIKDAEIARQKSEEQLRFITENMIDVVSFVDTNMVIQYISPSVRGSLGYDPADIRYNEFANIIPTEDLSVIKDQIETSVKQGLSNCRLEYRIYDVHQQIHWMESMANLVYDDDGKYAGAIFGSRDITDRKQIDDALRASESRYRTLVRNFPNGMVMLFDHDLRFTVVDGTGLDQFGVNREQSEGKTLDEVFAADLVSQLRGYFHSALRGEVEDFELTIGEQAIQFYTVPIYDEHGLISGGMMMTQDITDRKDAVVALSSRAQFLSSLNEITRIALETSDTNELIQNIADLLVLLFEADACYITRWDAEHQRTIPTAASGAMREVYSKQSALDGEITLTSSVLRLGRAIVVENPFDSEYISASIAKRFPSASLLGLPLIGGGQKLGAAMIGYDSPHQFDEEEIRQAEQVAGQIALGLYKQKLMDEVRTYNQELEKRVRERTADLEAKNKELETFTYSVSHDLKAPLRGIDGYSRLLVEDHASKLDPEGVAFLQTIRQATNQMNQLIEDLLSYSRLERRNLTEARIDIQNLIGQIIKEKKLEIEKKNIRVQIDVPAYTVKMDGKALEQAIRNLLDNAIKFASSDRDPEISIKLMRDGGKYILSIQDNGIGFDMKYHDKIFDIFQRLHLTETYPGTGVGLALVKKAMQRVGGNTWATSEEGKGSTFYLSFPVEGDHD